MKRCLKTLCILAVILMALMLSATALADEGNVVYVGGAEKYIFSPGSLRSPTDLFPDFKNVMPGDSLTQQIYITNNAKNRVKIKLYIRSLGAQLGTDDFLSEMTLTVKQKGTTLLFEAPANETAQLTDWVYLGTLRCGGETMLDVTLDVPVTMGNEFQDAVGYLDWEFMVKEIPDTPPTGDDSRTPLMLCLIGVSVLGMAGSLFLIAGKRKRKAC